MTEDKKHQLDKLTVSDTLSYLGTRVFSMEECIRMQNKQLSEAKEIIKKMLYEYQRLCLIKKETIAEAEKFLKED